MTNLLKSYAIRFKQRYFDEPRLPVEAQQQLKLDRAGLSTCDPGPSAVVASGIAWLVRSQDMALHHDGGSSRDYSLIKGWASSYPETSGYIVPTLIEYADRTQDQALADRARRMLDWLVSIQFPEGGYMGGKIDASPRVPVTFNTGQILIGLAAGVRRFGDAYRGSMNLAAAWLCNSLDDDGCWRKHPTPFATAGEKAYETHVSWGLFEAARLEPNQGFGEAGLKQVRWALTKQQANGWFASNCLADPDAPLTHTIGYVLRGVIEAYRFSGEPEYLAAAQRTADALLTVIGPDGRIPGQLDHNWRGAAEWVCLTGSVQIAACWLLLYGITGKIAYADAARCANRFVRRTVQITGSPDHVGGVRGSFPVNGGYGKYEYLNWAAKFCIDAQLMEIDLDANGKYPLPPVWNPTP